jgi:hypothetical protein
MTTTTKHESNTRLRVRRPIRARALGVVGAAVAALTVWTTAVPLLGVDLVVRPGGGAAQPVGPGSVVVTSLIASLLGWALLALLEHRTSRARARAIWTAMALVAMLLSLGAPITAGVTTAAAVTLTLMHLAVAAVLIAVLRLSSPT